MPCVHIIIGTINVDIMQTESITYVVNVKSSDTYDSKNNDYIHDRIFLFTVDVFNWTSTLEAIKYFQHVPLMFTT